MGWTGIELNEVHQRLAFISAMSLRERGLDYHARHLDQPSRASGLVMDPYQTSTNLAMQLFIYATSTYLEMEIKTCFTTWN